MNKFIFFLVFFSLNLIGYFFFTLETKLPDQEEVKKVEQITEAPVEKEQKQKEKVQPQKAQNKKLKGQREISSVKKDPFVVDRDKLRKNLNIDEQELKALSEAFERVIDKSSEAIQE